MQNADVSRDYDDKYTPGSSEFDLFMNQNSVLWTSGSYSKLFYVIMLLLIWGLIRVSSVFNHSESWTAVNVLHGVLTYIVLHWIKGCPDETTQGEYGALTLYEQIDAGVPWTNTKKFLMIIPTLLTWISCHYADYKPLPILVNCGIFLILIIAKIPEMHRVRIFGINSTVGIDEPVEIIRERRNSNSVKKRGSKKVQ